MALPHVLAGVFWMLTVINAFNLVDIMDGLCATLALVAALSFFTLAIFAGSYSTSLLLAAFIGSLLAFFWYNKPSAKIYLGDKGLYLASLVSGLADVDAITLSIAEQTKSSQLAHTVGAIGITIAVVANSIVKSGIAIYSGGWRFGWPVGVILLGATCAGLGVLLIF